MHLFRKPLPPRRAAQVRTPAPWDPPEAELPGIVPISTLPLGRSDQAAIAVTGMAAYRSGFEFVITAVIRPDVPGFDEQSPDGPMRRSWPHYISLQLSDGRTITNERPRGGSGAPGPFLRSNGGGGTSHHQRHRLWAWPLPPAGPLEFRCDWPALGAGEARASVDAQLILDAAARSIRLWPERAG